MVKPILKFCPLCKYSLHKKEIDDRKRLICEKCGWVYYGNPLPVVVCAVRNKDNKLLLAKRNTEPGKNRWALPGGFIELNESPEKACLRELKEETGLRGKIRRLIGIYVQNTKYYNQLIVIGYEVTVIRDKLLLNSELKEGNFFSIKDIPSIPFLSHRKIVDEFFKKRQN